MFPKIDILRNTFLSQSLSLLSQTGQDTPMSQFFGKGGILKTLQGAGKADPDKEVFICRATFSSRGWEGTWYTLSPLMFTAPLCRQYSLHFPDKEAEAKRSKSLVQSHKARKQQICDSNSVLYPQTHAFANHRADGPLPTLSCPLSAVTVLT